MASYLPPLLKVGKANEIFNPNDYDYQFQPIDYSYGDDRYTKKIDYNAKMYEIGASFNVVDTDISVLEGKVTNISYDGTNNRTNIQDVNAGTIYQVDAKKIIQASGTSTGYNYLQNTSIKNLVVTDSISIPSGTTISGATYDNDLVINNPARILQSGSGINNLNATNFTGDVSVSGSLQGLSNSIYEYLSGLSQNVNTALLNLQQKTQNLSVNASNNFIYGSISCYFFE